MNKFLTLLKYLDPSKVTPEAAAEICATAGIQLSKEQAAELSSAYRTRGAAGLLPLMPDLIALRRKSIDSDSAVHESDSRPLRRLVTCPHCRHIIEV